MNISQEEATQEKLLQSANKIRRVDRWITKRKMKAMIKQMQSVIALLLSLWWHLQSVLRMAEITFWDIRNLMNVLRAVSENGINCNWYDDHPDPW